MRKRTLVLGLAFITGSVVWGSIAWFKIPVTEVDWRSPRKASEEIWRSVQQSYAPSKPQKLAACHKRLLARGVKFKMVSSTAVSPNQLARGCHKEGAVLVREIGGVSFGNQVSLSCPAALAMADWINKDLQPLAQIKYEQPVKRIHHIGTYQCRKIAGSRRMSQHSFANAIDISGFSLKNGKRISVLNHWKKPAKDSDFLKSVGRSACGRFNLVLSPDYNAAHRDHFHFDMGFYRRCRIDDDPIS
ncbi:MAG: extensin family protein [Alphaproteobacteria bacterium]